MLPSLSPKSLRRPLRPEAVFATVVITPFLGDAFRALAPRTLLLLQIFVNSVHDVVQFLQPPQQEGEKRETMKRVER